MRFTSKLSALALAAAGMATSIGAQAQSIDLRVTGTITPPTCMPVLAGGGAFDFGTIPGSVLNATEPVLREGKSADLSITCTGATHVAVKIVDNRVTSRVPGLTHKVDAALSDDYAFGLGMSGVKKIGIYVVRIDSAGLTLDGEAAVRVQSIDNAASWTSQSVNGLAHTGGVWYSWQKAGETTASAFTTMAGTISVIPVIDKASNLDLTNNVVLDGSATMELVYF